MTKEDLHDKGFDIFYEALTSHERVTKQPSVFCTDSEQDDFEELMTLKRLALVYLERKKWLEWIDEEEEEEDKSYMQYVYKLTEFGHSMKRLVFAEISENEARVIFAKRVTEHLKRLI